MDRDKALDLWQRALTYISSEYPAELEIARSKSPQTFEELTSEDFLRQYCFVVYASGFKYATIRAKFDDIEAAFCDFDLEHLKRKRSLNNVLKVFGNKRKAECFLEGTKAIAVEGFSDFKGRLNEHGAIVLVELPGIGVTTAYHLAKNIGLLDAGKPDIWLRRAADHVGARNVPELITFLHRETRQTRNVIDVAIWTLAKNGKLNGGSD